MTPDARQAIGAIIFDFNGVLADDETPHVLCFQQALAEFGLSLTVEDYYGTYLGMDERTCTATLLRASGDAGDRRLLDRIIARKAQLFALRTADDQLPLFPGAADFVKAARSGYRLAVASGGRRHQIDRAIHGTAIEEIFDVIVAADDCPIGKPDPAIYRMTLARLNDGARTPSLSASNCLVIEDSLAGIRSARQAGMKVLAVASTYPAERLREADGVLAGFVGLTPEEAVRMVA
ncbi:putative Hydrolase, HAD-superfamily [Nitrospira japonica]|uniref:Putative Hydrolase, HAD-superfamily n=1 Tax=Nitrospira japonica TaxID=1325564 RepID=A0A1W1I1V2_9BACT|nr:HAD family phosphatase [Nitrospira japonica]SLM46975.1 putative Hydrolase, HAD-superfamily [Nitrospira japonica]